MNSYTTSIPEKVTRISLTSTEIGYLLTLLKSSHSSLSEGKALSRLTEKLAKASLLLSNDMRSGYIRQNLPTKYSSEGLGLEDTLSVDSLSPLGREKYNSDFATAVTDGTTYPQIKDYIDL